jgi:hypothetical protein
MCDNNVHCLIYVAIYPIDTIVGVAIHPYCYNVCWMHIHLNEIPNYVATKTIATISVVATIIDHNASSCSNNHKYCNNIKNYCRVLLQRYYLQQLLTKVTLLLLECIATNMTLLQPYFTVAIDRFSSSASTSLQDRTFGLLVLYLKSISNFQILSLSLAYLPIQDPNRHRLSSLRSGTPKPPYSFNIVTCL